jgi:23S rRNA (guanine2445-N2)-methyltransferase / 23S rRNA (guanine2069-N7)-methyltransferase
METVDFFATSPKGMADLLALELTQLGALNVSETRAGVRFQGGMEIAYRACLWSRLANRVLLPLASFRAESPEALYDGVREIDWAGHLTASQTIAVDSNISTSKITHSHYAALKVKDAIVDSFTVMGGERPSVDAGSPDIRVNCYLYRDDASIYLDLSGNSLHQRHYRLGAGEAPLKENLAAAILLRARWPEMAADGGAFVDLMCGSGTLVIEAALMAADIAPGILRERYGFSAWAKHNPAMWERLVAEAEYRRQQGLRNLPPLLGFDNNRGVLARARENADRAGLGDSVSFAYQDIFDFRHDFPSKGLMASNPPYGRRLTESGELPALYKALGAAMRSNLKGWKAAVFTEDSGLGKHIGIRAEKLHSLFNGAIPCKLIHFSVEQSTFYRDSRLPRRIAAEALSDNALMFRNRLNKNRKQVVRWANRENITCYRLYDADLPDYAAAIDVYTNASSLEQWICIQEYEAPASIDPVKAKLRTSEMTSVVQLTFDVDDEHLFYKTRARQRGESQYERIENEGHFHQVSEGQCHFWVNFEDYLDTGLFLDHRPIRQRIFEASAGKSILNLFAYTGAVSVHAALGGASATTTVDMSRTYLDWAQRNFTLNNLTGSEHVFIQADCIKWLNEQKKPRYDLIFLDPPTFSNSKRMDQSFDVQKDHGRLIRRALRLLKTGGMLYFSTNRRQFKLDQSIVDQFEVKDISAETIPHDFKRRQNIHYCWMITT